MGEQEKNKNMKRAEQKKSGTEKERNRKRAPLPVLSPVPF